MGNYLHQHTMHTTTENTTKTEPQQRMELARARLRQVARALRQENPNDSEGPIPDAATLLEALAGDGPSLSVQLVPDFRGYARMGIGAYAVNHTAAGEPAELLISMATDAEKAGDRQVGEDRDNPDGHLIQPDDIAVRLGFENAAGLDVVEHQLRHLRAVHFPESVKSAATPASDEWRVMEQGGASVAQGMAAATAAQPAIPPGWKLVPIEPAPEMLEAAQRRIGQWTTHWYGEMWRACLDAAPAAPIGAHACTASAVVDHGAAATAAQPARQWLTDRAVSDLLVLADDYASAEHTRGAMGEGYADTAKAAREKFKAGLLQAAGINTIAKGAPVAGATGEQA